ncbi:MAG: nucleotidyltransferase domain-containing protein, partial [Candidatus Omnitrophica bacterium]|nr:nucleotidyltransferase domain-containing protein [Candidatus Omnitrophota bacterium]
MNRSGTEGLSTDTRKDLEEIQRILRDHLPQDAKPISIYLSGGFARGESGHYEYKGRSLPFGDYDIDVVVPRPLLEKEEDPVLQRIEEELGYRPVTDPSEPTLAADASVHNVLDLRFKTREEFLERAPDLAYYDFLQSRHLLEGEDLVSELKPLDLNEISIFSPWRILGNRLILLLKHTDTDFLERPPTLHEVLAFQLARCRLYLDLAGLLTFLLEDYRTGYLQRVEVLRASGGLWRGWVRDPERFLDLVETARQFKQTPRAEEITGKELFDKWFETAEDVGCMTPHLINLILLTKQAPMEKVFEVVRRSEPKGASHPPVVDPYLVDWKPLVARQVRQYPSLFYRDFIEHYIRRSGRRLPSSKLLCGFASRYYGTFENATWRGRKWVLKNLRRSVLSPAAFQAAVLPLVAYSLTPKLEIKNDALEFFDQLMNPYMMMPFDFLPDLKRWE